MSLKAAVPRITRSAPARSASRTAGSERSPPPYCTGTCELVGDLLEVVPATGRAVRAPSRSTTCRKRAPASTQARAASRGRVLVDGDLVEIALRPAGRPCRR